MRTRRRINTLIALVMVLCLSLHSVALMEGNSLSVDGIFSVNLSTLTDEELAEIAESIRAEQRARIKTHIVLDNNELKLAIGKSQKIVAKIEDLPEGEKVPAFEWSSSDSTVVTCNKGAVKAVGAGKAAVICSATLADGMQISTECTITVIVPVSSVATDKKSITLDVTKSVTPSIIFKPDNATDKGLKFVSSDPSVASVDIHGKISGLSAGKAIITATTTDGSGKTVSVTVNVEDNRSSIGKRTSAIKGAVANEMCEYISYEFTNLNNIVNSKRNGPLIAESMFAILQKTDANFISNRTCYMGLSKDDKRKMYIACCDTSGKYWMVIFEPDRNNITYSKDTKNAEDAVAFMEYNCSSYNSVKVNKY